MCFATPTCTRSTTAWLPTCWPSIAWPSPSNCGDCTPECSVVCAPGASQGAGCGPGGAQTILSSVVVGPRRMVTRVEPQAGGAGGGRLPAVTFCARMGSFLYAGWGLDHYRRCCAGRRMQRTVLGTHHSCQES